MKQKDIEGDKALIFAADVLKEKCTDRYICKLGGDELLVAGSDISDIEAAALLESLREGFKKYSTSYELSASMGYARGTCTELDDIEHLMRVADEAMYEEKKLSKNTTAFKTE